MYFSFFDSWFLFFQLLSAIFLLLIFNVGNQTKRLIFYVSISAFLVSIIGLLNYYGYSLIFQNIQTQFKRDIIKSTIGQMNYVSNFLASVLPLILFGYFKEKGKFKTTFYWISGTFAAVVILLCQTRTIFLGLFLSLLFFLFFYFRSIRREVLKIKQKKTFFLLVSFVIALSFFIYPFESQYKKISNLETALSRTVQVVDKKDEGSPYMRELEWKTSWEMFKDKPLLGHGWGSFKLLSADYQMRITNSDPKYYGYYQKDYESHSDWLQFLAEGGILLFSVFAFLVIWIAVNGIKKIMKGDLFIAAVFCGWLVILIHSFVEFPFHMQPSLAMFVIFSAILLEGVKTYTLKPYWRYVFLLLMIPVLYVGGRAYLSDVFSIQSKLKLAKVEFLLKEYEEVESVTSQIQNIDHRTDSFANITSQISTAILKDTMDLIFLSKYGLEMNPDDTFINSYLSAGVSFLRHLPKENQQFILSYYAPFPKYRGPTNYAIQYRNPPTSQLSVPENSEYFSLLTISKLYCEIKMNTVNMPLDPLAMRGIGNITRISIKLMQDEKELSDNYQTDADAFNETLDPWYEWMKYSYRLALKMNGRDSSNWNCVDLEFLNALLETEGPNNDFQEEFIQRLEHRQKLIEYEIDTDLPDLWYDFIDVNIELLTPEYREKAEEILSQL